MLKRLTSLVGTSISSRQIYVTTYNIIVFDKYSPDFIAFLIGKKRLEKPIATRDISSENGYEQQPIVTSC